MTLPSMRATGGPGRALLSKTRLVRFRLCCRVPKDHTGFKEILKFLDVNLHVFRDDSTHGSAVRFRRFRVEPSDARGTNVSRL
jgi:hypothetical protein